MPRRDAGKLLMGTEASLNERLEKQGENDRMCCNDEEAAFVKQMPRRPQKVREVSRGSRSLSQQLPGASSVHPNGSRSSVCNAIVLANMIASSLRLSRRGALRMAQQYSAAGRRSFTAGAVRAADPIQDMYLRELKAYKPTPVKASDSEGHVHKFTAPAPPKSPEVADLASQMKEYESSTVDVEGQSQEAGAGQSEVDWFEEEMNFDEPEEAHH